MLQLEIQSTAFQNTFALSFCTKLDKYLTFLFLTICLYFISIFKCDFEGDHIMDNSRSLLHFQKLPNDQI